MSKASVTKLSGVSIQVASFASTLDLPTSELVAVVSLNLGQSDRIADLRQVLEVDGLSTIITNESTLVIVSVQVDFDGLLNGLRLDNLVFKTSGNRNGMRVVLSISLQAIKAEGSSNNLNVSTLDEPALEFLVFRNIFQGRQVLVLALRVQLVGCIMSIRPRCAFGNDRCIPAAEANVDFIRNDVGTAFVCCKRCKRHAHDNHEHSSQQSQQTSFKVRFLHVNFSYSLKFI